MRKLRFFAMLVLIYSLLGTSLVHAAARKVVKRAPVEYPRLALKMKIDGEVKLAVDVNADGKVANVRFISGHLLLRPAAVECLKKWEFESGSGKTTEVVSVVFKLPD